MRPAQKIHVLKHRFFSKMSHKIRCSNGAVQIFHETLTPACKACRSPTNAVRDAASGALKNLAKNYECLHPPRPPHSGLGSPSPRRVGPVRRPRHARRSSRPDRKRQYDFCHHQCEHRGLQRGGSGGRQNHPRRQFHYRGWRGAKTDARLNANGTIDTTFNPDAANSVNFIAVQPDGKIVMGGVTRNRMTRINPDGRSMSRLIQCKCRYLLPRVAGRRENPVRRRLRHRGRDDAQPLLPAQHKWQFGDEFRPQRQRQRP